MMLLLGGVISHPKIECAPVVHQDAVSCAIYTKVKRA